jgi:hypothetical protein
MDRSGDQLFPRSGFAHEQNGRGGARHLPRQAIDIRHRGAVADHSVNHVGCTLAISSHTHHPPPPLEFACPFAESSAVIMSLSPKVSAGISNLLLNCDRENQIIKFRKPNS